MIKYDTFLLKKNVLGHYDVIFLQVYSPVLKHGLIILITRELRAGEMFFWATSPGKLKKSISCFSMRLPKIVNFQSLSALLLPLLKCSVSAFVRSLERKCSTDPAAIPSFLLESGKFLSIVSSNA